MKHQDFFDSLLEPCSVARNQPFDCDMNHFPFCLIYHLKKDQLVYQERLVSTCENMMHQDHCEEAGESFQWRSHGLSSDNTSSVCFHQNPGEGDAHLGFFIQPMELHQHSHHLHRNDGSCAKIAPALFTLCDVFLFRALGKYATQLHHCIYIYILSVNQWQNSR